ncbi:Flagellar hook-length control protein FliK [Fimbriiglobus ruber]|uniref:Flagellar hook-length control protein FliK n=1 Tax=Fimbriiglobus ruber TaxID=1908690 RepID=A0A225DUA2_9BACT|nr:Flagellar hook-length control protein FliK [Fimbriiglobus ruber]
MLVSGGLLELVQSSNHSHILAEQATGNPATITGSNSNDVLTVDFSGGNPLAGGVTFNAGASNNGTIDITGETATTETYSFTNAHSGSVNIDGSTINYSGLAPIVDNGSASNRIFTYTGSGGTITLAAATAGNDTISANTGETVTFANPSATLEVDANSGANSITVNQLDSGFNAGLTLNATGSTSSTIVLNTSTAAAVAVNSGGSVGVTTALNVGANALSLTAGTSISQTAAITGGSLTTSSSTGTNLGTSTNAVTSFNATNTTSGNISLTNTAASLTIAGITEAGGGSVTVTNTGGITVSGAISAATTGAVSLTTSSGLLFNPASSLTTAGGNITLLANSAGTATGNFIGIEVNDATIQAGGSGSVSLTGSGGLTGSDNFGVEIHSGATVAATGTGTVSVAGHGGAGTVTNDGVIASGAGTQVKSAAGAITVSGTAGPTGVAITLSGGASISTPGNVSLTGDGGTGSGGATGILEADTSSFIDAGLLTTSSDEGTSLVGPNAVASFNATNTTGGVISLTNTAAPLTIAGITEAGGGSVTVTNTGGITVSGAISAATTGAVSLTAADVSSTAAGTINTGGGLTVTNTDATSTLNGVISGAGSLIKAGTGTVTLTTINSYAGGTTINTNGGTLALAMTGAVNSFQSALGSGNITVNTGGTLLESLPNQISDNATLTLNGGTWNVGSIPPPASPPNTALAGSRDYIGNLILGNNAQVIGTGWFIVGGTTTPNPVTPGTITVLSGGGTISARIVLTSPFAINHGSRTQAFNVASGATLSVTGPIVDDDLTESSTTATGSISLTGGGTLILTGANTYTGTTTISAGVLQVGNVGTSGNLGSGVVTDNANLTYDLTSPVTAPAGITGSGSLTQAGTGTLTIAGAESYNGATTVTSGTLLINGSVAGNAVATSPGVLGGTGTIGGSLTGTGTISPGSLPGNHAGILKVTGNFTPTGTVQLDVNSPYNTAGTDYDQIIVGGTVNLSGATLNIQGGTAAETPLQVLTLVKNNGSGSTVASANPADGSTVTLGSATFKLFYNGGAGHDVVLVGYVAPTTVYTNPAWATYTNGTLIPDADSIHAGNQPGVYGVNAFATISAGVAAVASGGTVIANAGLYHENVVINKPLTLTGANTGVSGSSGSRTTETEVLTNGNQNAIIQVTASNVTIDGVYLEGNDPAVTGNTLASGVDENANYGVLLGTGAASPTAPAAVTIENTVVKDVFIGVRGDGPASGTPVAGSLITNDWFDSIGNYDFGYAVSLRSNFYADVTNNLMTRVWTGVHLSNFSLAGGPATWSVAGNTIQSYAAGVWYNLQYQGATGLTLNNNQISAATGAVPNNFGVLMSSVQDTVNPTVTNNTITGTDYGVVLFNASTTNTVTLGSTNTVTGTKVAGVYLTDDLSFDPIGTTTFGTTSAATGVVVSGLPISPASGVGIEIDATANSPTTLTVTGSPAITGGTTGLLLTGADAAVTGNTLGTLSFTGVTGNDITLANGALAGQTLNATGVSFDGNTGATATLAQAYAIEDKIADLIDTPGLGFVRIKAATVFVTPLSEATTTGAVQRAVTVASANDIVNVEAGLYHENVVINKPLTLTGANTGVSGAGTRGAETELLTNGNQNAIIQVTASNVTIDGVYLEGNDPAVTGTPLASGVDTNANYGVLLGTGAASPTAPAAVTVENTVVKDVFIGVRGDGPASGTPVAGSLITNDWFDSIGNYDFGYAVSLRSNFYADVTNNLMTRVWTGVHLSNFSLAGGPATWSVAGNSISSYAAGVWYNLQYQGATGLTLNNNQISAATGAVPNNFGVLMATVQNAVNPTVTNNTITRTDYGVVLFNTSTSNTVTLGSTNTVTGTKVAGVYLTDDLSFDPIGTTTFGTTSAATGVIVSGLPISPASGVGIEIDASGGTPETLTVAGSPAITGGTTGLLLSGADAAVTGNTLGTLSFTGVTGNDITLAAGALVGQTLNATGVTFDGVVGSTATPAQGYAIEDKITDAIDDPSLGFVRIKAGSVFVTPNSFSPPATTTPSINRGLAVALPGDTVDVEGGTYPEAVSVAVPVTLVATTPVTANSVSTSAAVSLSGSFTATAAAGFSFGSPVSLAGDTSLTASAGSVGFTSTVDGAHGLTVSATGNTSFGGPVGGGTPLTSLSVTSGTLTAGAIATTGGVTISDSGAGSVTGPITGGPGATLVQSGAGTLTLAGNSTYGGSTTVTNGTLLVNGNNAAATGAVAVNGGVLGGTGTLGGAVTVNAGGTITGGTLGGVGTLTVASLTMNGGTYAADFSGNTSDTIATAGAIKLANATPGTFAVNSQAGAAAANNVFTLIQNTGTGAIASPPLTGAPENGTATIDGAAGYYSYSGGNGQSFTFTANGGPTFTLPTAGNYTLERVTTGGIDDIELLQGATVLDSRPTASITGPITVVDASAGPDTLTIDYTASGGYFQKDVVFNGSGNDTLDVTGGTFGTIVYTYTGTNTGTIQNYQNPASVNLLNTITFSGLAPIMNTGTAADMVFNLPAGSAATLSTPGAGMNQLASSPVTFEQTDFTDPTGSLTVNAAAAGDTVTVNGVDTGFGAAVFVTADSNITVNGLSNTAGTGGVTLTSNNGALTVQGTGIVTAGTVTVTAPGLVTVEGSGITNTAGTGNVSVTSTSAGVTVTGGIASKGKVTVTAAGSTSILGISNAGGTGNVTVTTTAGTLLVDDGGITTAGAATLIAPGLVTVQGNAINATAGTGNVTVTSTGAGVTINGSLAVTAKGKVTVLAAGAIDIDGAGINNTAGTANVLVTSTGAGVTVQGPGGISSKGTVTVLADGNTDISGGINNSTGTGPVSVTTFAGTITVEGSGIVTDGSALVTAPGAVTVQGATGINNSGGTGLVTVTSLGAGVTVTGGGILSKGLVTVLATGGDVSISGSGIDNSAGTKAVVVTASAGSVFVAGTGIHSGGTVAVIAAQNLAVTGPIASSGGAVTLNFGQNNAGGTAMLGSPVTGTTVNVNGGTGADTVTFTAMGTSNVTVDGKGLATATAGAVDQVIIDVGTTAGTPGTPGAGKVVLAATTSPEVYTVTINGTAGADTYDVNDTVDQLDHPIAGASGARMVNVNAVPVLDYSGANVLAALTTLNLAGAGGGDTYNVQFADGNTPTSALPATVAIQAGGGTDVANLFGTDAVDTFDVNFSNSQVVTGTTDGATTNVTYTANLPTLNVYAKDGSDTFYAHPDPNTAINLDGGSPVQPVSPGDTLILSVVGVSSSAVLSNIVIPNGNLMSVDKQISWVSIETIPVPLGLGGSFQFDVQGHPTQIAPGDAFIPVGGTSCRPPTRTGTGGTSR